MLICKICIIWSCMIMQIYEYDEMIFIHSFLPCFLASFLPSFLASLLPTFLPSYLPTFLLASFLSCSFHTISILFDPEYFFDPETWGPEGGRTKAKGHMNMEIGALNLETFREVESMRMSPEPFCGSEVKLQQCEVKLEQRWKELGHSTCARNVPER